MKKTLTDMGQRIKTRRKELNMTQGQLAEAISISNNHLSSIETGKQAPSLEVLLRICESLGTRPDYLLLGSISGHNTPQTLVENLQLCSEHDLKLVKRMVDYMVELNTTNRSID